uniref:Pseudouridine synthase n=1 Tax=Panagrellus redivivus TaxID=6233 RepID=A0A7E4V588_PANRE
MTSPTTTTEEQRTAKRRSNFPELALEASDSKKSRQGAKESKADEEEEAIMASQLKFTVKDGIRHLAPYWTTYRTWTKFRWLGRSFEEVFGKEFLSTDKNYARVAAKFGRVFINGKQETNPGYILKNNDRIIHFGHRHEHPILDLPVTVITETEDLLVVDKPPSVPVHACGQYKANTVLAMLAREQGYTDLRVVHRLDRATSGVLIFARNYATDIELKKALVNCDWKKEYICRVRGHFPDGEVECTEPIGNLSPSMGIQCVRPEGKVAQSKFRRLFIDGEESVVSVKIATGRTHQIRVHLQWLGYPIVSDLLYNSDVWGPQRGKHADYGKPLEQLRADVQDAHKASAWRETTDPDYESRMVELAASDEVVPEPADLRLEDRPEVDPICIGCHTIKKTPSMDHMRLHLHCWRYETAKGTFEAPLPDWAIEKAGEASDAAEAGANC